MTDGTIIGNAKQVAMRFDPAVYAEFKQIAKDSGISMSLLVRTMTADFIARHKAGKVKIVSEFRLEEVE